ncbi:MAG TPA: AAA family ATPase [Myxococcota bacterium]|nr:AAA family ATPase [Myxococcota bacterium]
MATREPGQDVERRYATALFIDISGFTRLSESLDPEETHSVVRPLLHLLAGTCERYGGFVHMSQGDCVFALFGVPNALEDAARAAVNAAIEMHNAVQHYNRERGTQLDVHTGINSGLMVVGSGLVHEVDVTSRAVNTASRLKDSSQRGQIWVGEETWRAIHGDFEARDLGPMPFKGVEGGIRVFEILSRSPLKHRSGLASGPGVAAELVGRAEEFDRLRKAVEQLLEGRGGVAQVIGDAGLGKSRLVAEARRSFGSGELLWLEGRSLATGANRSFHPFGDLLQSWLGVHIDATEQERLERLVAAIGSLLGESATDVIPFVATLMGLRLGGEYQARLAGIGGEPLENLTLRAVIQLLRALAARQPVALVFDDLHWADVSSLDLLSALLPLGADDPILFVLSMRPDPPIARTRIAESLQRLEPERCEEIVLAPLDQEAAGSLIQCLFEKGDLPPAARRLLVERAGGNPFYIGEVVRSLVDQHAIERRGEALFVTERIDEISIPGNVGEVILSRIDRLPARIRSVLQVAAILGRVVDLRILERIAESDDLGSDLASLTDANLLAPGQGGGLTYEFAHPLIQETLYAAVSFQKRRVVHAAIARAIQEVFDANDRGYHAQLAYHYAQARELEIAREHLALACDEGGASTEALQFLEDAAALFLESSGDSTDEAHATAIHRKLALAYLSRGKMIEGNHHLDRALVLLGQRVPTTRYGRRWRHATATASAIADLFLGRDPARRRRATPQERELIHLMYAAAQAQVTTDPAGFIFESMVGMRRLNQVDPRSVERAAGIYAGAVGFLAYAGLPLTIRDRLLRRAERFVNTRDPRDLFTYRVFRFIHHFLAGDWDEVHRIDGDLTEENLQLGEIWLVINYLPLDAKRLAHQGRFAEASEELERIGKIGELYAYDLARSNEHAVRMFIQLERRELDSALRTARSYYEAFDEDLLNLFALGHEARIETLLGDLAAAASSLERAERILARAGFVPPFHRSAYWVARLGLDLERLEHALQSGAPDARALRRKVELSGRKALADARKVAWQLPETLALLAREASLTGHPRKSLDLWSEAVDTAERLGMRPQLGRIWRDVGLQLRAEGPGRRFRGVDAEGCLARAAEIFEDLDLERDLEWLRDA